MRSESRMMNIMKENHDRRIQKMNNRSYDYLYEAICFCDNIEYHTISTSEMNDLITIIRMITESSTKDIINRSDRLVRPQRSRSKL